METTKEKLKEEAARHRVETAEKKVEATKAEMQEKIDDVKIGAVELAEKAEEKWDNLKDKAKDKWEDTKDDAEALGDKIAEKAREAKEKVKEKLS